MRLLISFLAAVCVVQAVMILLTMLSKGVGSAQIRIFPDRFELKIYPDGYLPKRIFVKIRVKNLYTNEEIEVKTGGIYPCKKGVSYSAELKNMRCGAIRAEICGAEFGVLTSIFHKKARLSAEDITLIMPEMEEVILDLSGVFLGGDTPRRRLSGGLADGAREYCGGDRLGDIHMKLSAKVGKYMVRERFGGENAAISVAFSRAKDPDTAEKNAALLFGIVCKCFSNGAVCRVICGDKAVEIHGEDDIESGFYSIFCSEMSCEIERFAEKIGLVIRDGEVEKV